MHNAPLSVNFSISLSSTGEAGQKQPIAGCLTLNLS